MELTFKEFLQGGKEQLARAGFAEVEAEHLLAHTLGISRMDLHNPLTVENALSAIGDLTIVEETYWKLLDRRCAHEPLQYLTGVAYFRHLELKVGPGVLVPRPESELLVEAVLTHLEKLPGAVSVVDLGSGSGAGHAQSHGSGERSARDGERPVRGRQTTRGGSRGGRGEWMLVRKDSSEYRGGSTRGGGAGAGNNNLGYTGGRGGKGGDGIVFIISF